VLLQLLCSQVLLKRALLEIEHKKQRVHGQLFEQRYYIGLIGKLRTGRERSVRVRIEVSRGIVEKTRLPIMFQRLG